MEQYLADAHGCILMYSLQHRNSIDALAQYYEELARYFSNEKDNDPVILHLPTLVLGNKSDREERRPTAKKSSTLDQAKVIQLKARRWADTKSIVHITTSAKDNVGIQHATKALIPSLFEAFLHDRVKS